LGPLSGVWLLLSLAEIAALMLAHPATLYETKTQALGTWVREANFTPSNS
jgi:hypothetical protein